MTATNDYFSDTAYKEKDRYKQPKERATSEFSSSEQDLRVTRLPDYIACNELLSKESMDVVRLFNFNDGSFEKKIGDFNVWEELYWDTSRNKKSLWRNLKIVLVFFSVAAFIAVLFSLFNDYEGVKQEPESLLVFFVPFIAIFIFAALEKYSKASNLIKFNRRTGMVTIPRKGKAPFIRPFAEFVPYSFYHTVLMGVNYHMYLAHREEEIGAKNLDGRKEEASPLVDWALLVQFMDSKQPLPDVPLYEPFRHLDPTTAEYDIKSGRPERYWRDFELLEVMEMHVRSENKLREFNMSVTPKKVSFKTMQWPSIQRYEKKERKISIAT